MGSSSPSDLRIASRSAADVSMETIWLTGSPTKRNIEKAIIPTAIMTAMAWMARRSVKASISFPTSLCRPRGSLFLFGRPVEQDLVVRALGQLHPFRNAPRQRLLVQGDIAVILDADFESLLDHLIALGGVGLDQNLVGERIQFLVAIAAEIGFAARGIVGIVAATQNVEEHVV